MNEFLELYPAKIIEYLLAISYLVLFVGFWRWVQGEKAPGREPDVQPAHHGRKS
ncbi:MAG: hypothetical protein ACJ79R_04070 [Anaeromyxobacteraceae bacterium]